MDRETLVPRNRAMAAAMHQQPLKHRVRHLLLKAAASAPILPKRIEQERILVIRPDHLGDVLLTTPALHLLRAARPQAEIHALVGSWSAAVMGAFDSVDVVLTLPFPGFARGDKQPPHSPYLLALHTARQLRRIGYSHALIMRPDHWWGAVVARWAGIPQRIGYDDAETAPFLSDALPRQHEHVVVQNARLVERITGSHETSTLQLRFPIADDDQEQIESLLKARGAQNASPIIAIHPGSGTWVKQWEAAQWAQVADAMLRQTDGWIVITGGDHERALAHEVLQQMRYPERAILLAGETDLGTLAAVFARSRLVFGSDSGPLHLACAVGTPTVALYGPADPVEFGSWGDPTRHFMLTSAIGCRPCRVLDWGGDKPEYHPCVREIPVARVVEAGLRLLAANPE